MRYLLLPILFVYCTAVFADLPPWILDPTEEGAKEKPKKVRRQIKPLPALEQEPPKEEPEEPVPQSGPRGFQTTTDLSLLAITPFIKKDLFENLFEAAGVELLFSFPMMILGKWVHLHIEGGLQTQFTTVVLTQPSVRYNHSYFSVPVHAKLIFPLGTYQILGEAIAGIRLHLLEYDSRSTTDGGLFLTRDLFGGLDPDIGFGVTYKLSDSWKIRILATYLRLGAGITLVL